MPPTCPTKQRSAGATVNVGGQREDPHVRISAARARSAYAIFQAQGRSLPVAWTCVDGSKVSECSPTEVGTGGPWLGNMPPGRWISDGVTDRQLLH